MVTDGDAVDKLKDGNQSKLEKKVLNMIYEVCPKSSWTSLVEVLD